MTLSAVAAKRIFRRLRARQPLSEADIDVLEESLLGIKAMKQGRVLRLTRLALALWGSGFKKQDAIDEAIKRMPGVLTYASLEDCVNGKRTRRKTITSKARAMFDFMDGYTTAEDAALAAVEVGAPDARIVRGRDGSYGLRQHELPKGAEDLGRAMDVLDGR